MNRLAVLNVVGLNESLIGEHTPRIAEFLQRGKLAHIRPAFPAVTSTAQSNYLTGKTPATHGVVGNGWFHRELNEIHFWKQSNAVVGAPKIWETLRAQNPDFTCANCFWWFNMYSSVDYAITPRPMYPADSRKFFDVYSWPYAIRTEIKKDLGEFPFFGFWGPAAGVDSPQGKADCATRWIANSAKWIEQKHSPTLNLVYLPHLDYNLQRYGPFVVGDEVTSLASKTESQSKPPHVGSYQLNPRIHRDLREIDAIVGDLLDFFRARGVAVVLLSEYGITNVDQPIHLNRIFREQGWLTVKEELGLELLDAGASKVFAVTDHQVAHIYLNDRSLENAVRTLVEKTLGVEKVLGAVEQTAAGIHHERAGDLIAVAQENAWFTYYHWLDDARAPDFARCVDIHRKAGYDPVELFLNPQLPFPKLKIAWRLLQKKLGFRMLMDVIPLDATLVKGSHGRVPENKKDWPVFITSQSEWLSAPQLDSTDVAGVLQRHCAA
jgi:predicted AlkP superfamily pyrophosphatase or phosphodiesterase